MLVEGGQVVVIHAEFPPIWAVKFKIFIIIYYYYKLSFFKIVSTDSTKYLCSNFYRAQSNHLHNQMGGNSAESWLQRASERLK